MEIIPRGSDYTSGHSGPHRGLECTVGLLRVREAAARGLRHPIFVQTTYIHPCGQNRTLPEKPREQAPALLPPVCPHRLQSSRATSVLLPRRTQLQEPQKRSLNPLARTVLREAVLGQKQNFVFRSCFLFCSRRQILSLKHTGQARLLSHSPVCPYVQTRVP